MSDANAARGAREPAKLVLWAGSFEAAGTQRFLLELLRRLDRARFRPVVFSTLARGELLPVIRALGVPVHEFGTGRRMASGKTLRDLSAAARFLRRERVDVLSCMLGLTTLVGPFVGRAAGVPVVVNHQRNLSYWLHGGLKERVYGFVNRRLVDAVLVNSGAARAELVDRFGVSGSMIENVGVGTDVAAIDAVPADAEVRRSLAPNGERVVGIVAKLSPVKGHRIFLKAAARTAQRTEDVVFAVVGDGPEREALESEAVGLGISERVRFLGVREDVPALLKAMDVMVLSSTSEGSPNVILEAAAAGVPVVSTRVGGVPELVADGETGLLVEPGDAVALSEAVGKLLEDRELAERMGRRAHEIAHERFDIDAVVLRIEDAFDRLLDASPRRGGRSRIEAVMEETAAGGTRGETG